MTIANTQQLSNVLLANGYGWKCEFAPAAPLAAGASVMLGMVTGPDGAIIGDRSFTTDGAAAFFGLYRSTSWTGGSPLTLFNRNDRFWSDTSRSPVASMASAVTAAPAASDLMGSVTLRSLGAPTVSITTEGQDIYLAPNASYVVVITNNDGAAKTPALSLVLFRDRVSSGVLRIGA